MNWALNQETGSAAAKSVLLILANRADHKGVCWPGIDGIARQTELSRRTVIRQIKNLEDGGFISVIHRGGEGEGRKSNVYQCHIGQCAIDDRQSATVSGLSDTVTPEPSYNPKKNRKTIRASQRVPVEWSPSDKLLDYALEQGMSPEVRKAELENFRDWEFTKARTDWDACWRTWCRNWKKWGKEKQVEPSRARAL